MPHLVAFTLGLVVVAGTTVGLLALAGVRLGVLPVWALVRAAAQLAVVALVLRGVLTLPITVLAFLALMLLAASLASGGRLAGLRNGRRIAAAGVVVGAVPAVGALLALQLVSVDARDVVAVGGIVVGNAMSAATLSGRNFLRASRTRVGEVEGWLALGATPTRAHLDLTREAVRETLIPTLDQTRSTGLVTLPGAFVGALFGGASPAEAAEFQLTVLAGIALASTITAIVVTRLAGRSPLLVPVETA